MGSNGPARVPYLKKVNSEEVAKITVGICFCFGKDCNDFYNNGKYIGSLDYVGEHGPGLRFKVRGKKNSIPGDIEDKYIEMLTDLGIPVPMME